MKKGVLDENARFAFKRVWDFQRFFYVGLEIQCESA